MPIIAETDGGIAILKLSVPKDSYIDETLIADLDRAVRKADENDAVKVIVITGAEPGSFILHYNLRDVEATSRQLVEKAALFGEHRHIPERRIDLLFRRLETSPKITICAIGGTALGGAAELALACDFRLMQKGDFLFGVPEIRIGMLPGAGGTQRLTRAVGVPKALDLILHGRRMTPEEAAAYGVLHEATDGPVLERALERARDLARLPAMALGHVKRLVYAANEEPLYKTLDLERALFLELMANREALQMVSELNASGGDFRTVD
ncbi:enoyl-CoA hydratase/isomerase family protein [Bosea sp. (in: a-proteobacteria)]|uniref:enoyl-CoA hydratase/isomerase family protein n=1 Tax=Bosea sp. (in: a-proteobacteria) TaxID=1871050 RepID=UPI00262C5CB3|nr:enoyl-CoA hydratase/isomerase family protein [Bosea sp. (in: a-proteobacteria)]MCO5090900.1 enoyl-CoA hydratase/isomerase family protein [Bosea sp. (in: a-proteobacteria)]